MIYHKWKKQPLTMFPPTILSGIKSSTAMAMSLIATLKDSPLIYNILASVYNTSRLIDMCDGGLLNAGMKRVDFILKKEPSTKVKWDYKSGLQANAVQYPLMNAFGIPLDNNHTIDWLLSELIKLKLSEEPQINRMCHNFGLINYWNGNEAKYVGR